MITQVRVMSRRSGVKDWRIRTTIKVDEQKAHTWDGRLAAAHRQAKSQQQAWITAEPHTEFKIEEGTGF